MIDINKIYKYAVIILAVIVAVQGVYYIGAVLSNGPKYKVAKLLSNARYTNLDGEKIYYYTGSSFASYDLSKGTTNRVTGLDYVPNVTGAIWLDNGVIFSASKVDQNSNVAKLDGTTWYVDYKSGVIENISGDAIQSSYNSTKTTAYTDADNVTYFYSNADKNINSSVLMAAGERVVNVDADVVWTYDSNEATFIRHTLDNKIKTIKSPRPDVIPIYASDKVLYYGVRVPGNETFNLYSYNTKDEKENRIFENAIGGTARGGNPLFINVREGLLRIEQLKDSSASPIGYIDQPGIKQASNIEPYQDGFIYATNQGEVYLFNKSIAAQLIGREKKYGIEKFATKSPYGITRLTAGTFTNDYVVYYPSGQFKQAQSYMNNLFKTNDYDVNRYGVTYQEVIRR